MGGANDRAHHRVGTEGRTQSGQGAVGRFEVSTASSPKQRELVDVGPDALGLEQDLLDPGGQAQGVEAKADQIDQLHHVEGGTGGLEALVVAVGVIEA